LRRERARRLALLREALMAFGVSGHFMQVSSRHALHRYYRLVRRGLDVPLAWQEVRQAVTDLTAQETARRERRLARGVGRNLHSITNVQKVVHLIEYLLASVYLAHLWHMFASEHPHLKELVGEHAWGWVVSIGVLVSAGLGWVGVYIVNRLIERRPHGKSAKKKLVSNDNRNVRP